jgi:opacity protein-like surface antigen
VALQYGAKYVRSNIDGKAYTGYTDLLGAGFRRDLNKRWDAGMHADLLHSWRSDVMKFGWGIDVGVTLGRNIWLSIGYNFAGFDDQDFSGGNYTAEGPFITIRMKVDQDTFRQPATGGKLPGHGDND